MAVCSVCLSLCSLSHILQLHGELFSFSCIFWWKLWRGSFSLSCSCSCVVAPSWCQFISFPHFIICLSSISCRTRQSFGRPVLNERHSSWTPPWWRGGAIGRQMTNRLGGTRTSCSPCTCTRKDWTRATRQQVSEWKLNDQLLWRIRGFSLHKYWRRKVDWNIQSG